MKHGETDLKLMVTMETSCTVIVIIITHNMATNQPVGGGRDILGNPEISRDNPGMSRVFNLMQSQTLDKFRYPEIKP
jgi:hypothetical protein